MSARPCVGCVLEMKGWSALGACPCVIAAAKALLQLTNGTVVSTGSWINSNNAGRDKEVPASVKPSRLNTKHMAVLSPAQRWKAHAFITEQRGPRVFDSTQNFLFPVCGTTWEGPAGIWGNIRYKGRAACHLKHTATQCHQTCCNAAPAF